MRRIAASICAAVVALTLAACGTGRPVTPSIGGLPLAARSHVTLIRRVCNDGSDAYCALEFVVVGSGYRTSLNLLGAEQRILHRRGWVHADAPEGLERAADSPGDKLRVTYATANGELQGVDLGWIKRPHAVALALSRAMLAHQSALSVVLQVGTA